jgi:hypothetical protein
MQIKKRILCAERLRQVPPQFSWVDQRLVRQRYVHQCEPTALAHARQQLCQRGLIAYEPPLYQVLALEAPAPPVPPAASGAGHVVSVKEVLQQLFQKGGAI